MQNLLLCQVFLIDLLDLECTGTLYSRLIINLFSQQPPKNINRPEQPCRIQVQKEKNQGVLVVPLCMQTTLHLGTYPNPWVFSDQRRFNFFSTYQQNVQQSLYNWDDTVLLSTL